MTDIRKVIAKEWIKLIVSILVGVILVIVGFIFIVATELSSFDAAMDDFAYEGWPIIFTPYVLYQFYCSIVWAVKNKK